MFPTLYGGGEFAQSRFIFIRIGTRKCRRAGQRDAIFVIAGNISDINQLQAGVLLACNSGSGLRKAV